MSDPVNLPNGWISTPISNVVEAGVEQREPGTKSVGYIDIGSIDRSLKRIGEIQTVTGATAPTRARQWVKPGDVLVSMTRPNLNAVAMVPTELDGSVCSTGFDVLRAVQVEPGWLFARVRSTEFVSDICDGLQGVVYPAVRPAKIRQHEFPIPPAREQRLILSELDSYNSRLDETDALLNSVQRNLKRYRASVLKAAVEGRLVPTEAELARTEKRDYEPASVLLKRMVQRPGAARFDTIEAADALPEGWCLTTIGTAFDVNVGSTPSRDRPDFWGGDIAWVSSGEVAFRRISSTHETISRLGYESSSTKLNPPGTVLIGMIGEGKTRGQVAILDIAACNNQNAAAIRVADSGASPDYVYYYLMSQYEKNRARGAGNNQPALNKARVQAIPLPLPPMAEQRRIVLAVEEKLSVVEYSEAQVDSLLRRAQKLRQSILKWAFEGKLVDQDPNDEPASVLLERIKGERANESTGRGAVRARGRRS